MSQCDYVVCCTPYTPDTHQLVSAAAIAAIKPNAVFINVGRGKCVDEQALIQGASVHLLCPWCEAHTLASSVQDTRSAAAACFALRRFCGTIVKQPVNGCCRDLTDPSGCGWQFCFACSLLRLAVQLSVLTLAAAAAATAAACGCLQLSNQAQSRVLAWTCSQ
jgi:ribosomal protein S27E